MKPILQLVAARQDVAEIIGYYRSVSDDTLALGFTHALEYAFGILSEQPRAGSPRLAEELVLPEVRTWLMRTFPYLIMYRDDSETVTVLRVIHTSRDIAAALTGRH